MFGGDETAASSIAKCTTVTEDIAEWSYGDYEGLRTAEIKALRSERGLDQEKPWDIWRDGCEGGEYVTNHEKNTVTLREKEKSPLGTQWLIKRLLPTGQRNR
jgi:broad specificity phosphatase PhoE